MLVVTGPFAVFFSSEDVQSTSPADHHIAYSTLSEDISPRLFHRSGGDEGPFDTGSFGVSFHEFSITAGEVHITYVYLKTILLGSRQTVSDTFSFGY
jgi:hypothetical protein